MTVDVDKLIRSAKRAHDEYMATDCTEDDTNVRDLVALHDLTRDTRAAPQDPDAAAIVVERGIAYLESSDPNERIFGIRLIRECGFEETRIADAILATLRKETDRDVVEWCVNGLYFAGRPNAIPDLLAFLDDPDPEMRYLVAGAISSCSVTKSRYRKPETDEVPSTLSEDAIRALIRLAEDREADVRFSALFELSIWWREEGFRDSRVEALLREGQSESDVKIRDTCLEAFEPKEVL